MCSHIEVCFKDLRSCFCRSCHPFHRSCPGFIAFVCNQMGMDWITGSGWLKHKIHDYVKLYQIQGSDRVTPEMKTRSEREAGRDGGRKERREEGREGGREEERERERESLERLGNINQSCFFQFNLMRQHWGTPKMDGLNAVISRKTDSPTSDESNWVSWSFMFLIGFTQSIHPK